MPSRPPSPSPPSSPSLSPLPPLLPRGESADDVGAYASPVRHSLAKIGGDVVGLVTATGESQLLGPHWPLATIALVTFQIFVHWQTTYRRHHSLCASPATILEDGHWSRVVSAAFHHEDRWQLGVNVVSFLWKGVLLESTIGTPLFAVVMAKLVLMVGVANTLFNLVLDVVFNSIGYDDACMCTFAGVLVALKVINEKRPNFNAFRWGLFDLELPPARVTWLELVVLHMSASRSLTTLLSGLLVGVLFTESIVSLNQEDQAALLFKAPVLPTTYGIVGLLLATHFLWPDLDPCVSYRVVFEQRRWQQLLLPSLYTFSSYHLVYVVLSLLSLGRQMELRYGHYNFLLLVLFVAVCVNVTHCLFAWILSRHPVELIRPLLPPSVRDTCFSGFTGSLFTLKMLLHKERPELDYDFASFQMAVPHWFGLMTEVAHLYMYTARAWLLGHIAGIAVGATLTLVHLPALIP